MDKSITIALNDKQYIPHSLLLLRGIAESELWCETLDSQRADALDSGCQILGIGERPAFSPFLDNPAGKLRADPLKTLKRPGGGGVHIQGEFAAVKLFGNQVQDSRIGGSRLKRETMPVRCMVLEKP